MSFSYWPITAKELVCLVCGPSPFRTPCPEKKIESREKLPFYGDSSERMGSVGQTVLRKQGRRIHFHFYRGFSLTGFNEMSLSFLCL